MSNWVPEKRDNDGWGSQNFNNKDGWDDNDENQNNKRDAKDKPIEQQARKSSFGEISREKKMSRKLGKLGYLR